MLAKQHSNLSTRKSFANQRKNAGNHSKVFKATTNHKKPSSKALTAVRKTSTAASFENALKAERTKLCKQFINLETAYIVRKAIQRGVKNEKNLLAIKHFYGREVGVEKFAVERVFQ